MTVIFHIILNRQTFVSKIWTKLMKEKINHWVQGPAFSFVMEMVNTFRSEEVLSEISPCCWVTSVMSDSVRPQRPQPTRLPRPWDSPGKNTSGLPFPSLMHESEKWQWSHSVVSDRQRPHGLQPTRLLRPWDSPGKSTGVGCHCPLRK